MAARVVGGLIISRFVTRTLNGLADRDRRTILFAGDNGRVLVGAPFAPGTVIETIVGVSQRLQCQRNRSSGYARAAGRDHRPIQIDPGFFDPGAKFVERQQEPVSRKLERRQVVRTRHMARSHALPGFRIDAGKTTGGPCIGDLACTVFDNSAHI